jgi:hypothetical protein
MLEHMLKVEKAQVPVIVYTATHRIEGTYFMCRDGRLSDDLNERHKHFIPLRDVRVTHAENGVETQFRCDFVAVSLQSIVLFCPNPKTHDTARQRLEITDIDEGAGTPASAPGRDRN